MNSVHAAYIGLGSNLDDPEAQIRRAIAALRGLRDLVVKQTSSIYLSAPVGHRHQPDFVNAVAELQTTLTPPALLDALLAMETRFGRERSFRDAPRILDLDLLLYDDIQAQYPGLSLPHPRMHERAFVLAPLLEIDPECVIPGRGPASQWLTRCAGQRVQRIVPR